MKNSQICFTVVYGWYVVGVVLEKASFLLLAARQSSTVPTEPSRSNML